MYRLLFILLLFIMPYSYSQQVLGIKFGSTYEDVKKMLEKRYGFYNVYDDNGILWLADAPVGDFHFDILNFEFQRQDNRSYFYYSRFSMFFAIDETELACKTIKSIWNDIKHKYANQYIEEYFNDDGFKCYKFGINPLDEDRVLGVLSLKQGIGNDGKKRLYLHLDYGPIYYIDKTSDF